MKTYKVHPIISVVASLGIIIYLGGFLYNAKAETIISPLGIVLISIPLLLFSYLIVQLITIRIIVYEDAIEYRSFFRKKKMSFDEIHHVYKNDEKNLIIQNINSAVSPITIPEHIHGFQELESILMQFNNPKINEEYYYKSFKIRTKSTNLSKSAYENNLIQARKLVKYLIIATLLVGIAMYLKWIPLLYWVICCIIIEVLFLALLLRFPGYYKIDGDKIYPSLFYAYLVLFGTLMLKYATSGMNILDFNSLWMPLIIFSLPYIYLTLRYQPLLVASLENILGIIFITLFILGFVGLTIIFSNQVFDNHDIEIKKAIIKEKETIKSSKIPEFIFELSYIQNDVTNDRINVKSNIYNTYDVSDTITLEIHKGRFNIPYLEVIEKK